MDDQVIAMKTCTKCKVEQPTTEFYRCKATRDGCQYRCKGCTSAAAAARYRGAPSRSIAQANAWRVKNPERSAASRAAYRAKITATRKRYVYLVDHFEGRPGWLMRIAAILDKDMHRSSHTYTSKKLDYLLADYLEDHL